MRCSLLREQRRGEAWPAKARHGESRQGEAWAVIRNFVPAGRGVHLVVRCSLRMELRRGLAWLGESRQGAPGTG